LAAADMTFVLAVNMHVRSMGWYGLRQIGPSAPSG
jgi:hypothetical protein